MTKTVRRPNLIQALTPFLFLIVFISVNVKLFEDTLDGPNQIALILAASLAGLIAVKLGYKWHHINKAIISNITKAMPALLILLLIGSLAGTWLISGVVPAMVFYGLKIIHPGIFLFTALIVCALVSLATGSSWSTVATVGVALLGIGNAMGMHEGLVAGAIISGAYFGDKMSPLSDTTILAPAVAGTDLYTHIRYMVITTVPSFTIAGLAFLFIGFFKSTELTSNEVSGVIQSIESNFFINPILLLVPVLLIVIIIRKVPPVPALLGGTLLGGIFAVIFQPELIKTIAGSGSSYFLDSYKTVMQAMFGHASIVSDNRILDGLFNTSGMRGMLNTVWLILAAMIFGGAMEASGLLRRITDSIIKRTKSDGALITSTIFSSVFFNLTASDQYISIVVPGKMFANSYKDRGLKPEVLSRTLEDGGTLTSVLVPWNSCGAVQAKVLGVSTGTYLPYCFFNIINPIVAIIMAYAGYKIRKVDVQPEIKD